LIATLQCLKKHGERLDSEIAEEMGVPLATVRERLVRLAAAGEIITCNLIRFESGNPVQALQCRVAGYVPPKTLGRTRTALPPAESYAQGSACRRAHQPHGAELMDDHGLAVLSKILRDHRYGREKPHVPDIEREQHAALVGSRVEAALLDNRGVNPFDRRCEIEIGTRRS
jgi:DNA-binding Lrp family transcriptional regulator